MMSQDLLEYSCRFNLETTGFLGCMRNIQVSSRGTYTQNLNNGLFVGMELGCKAQVCDCSFLETFLASKCLLISCISCDRYLECHLQVLNEVGLGGGGFLELPPEDLLSEAGLSISFRTFQNDALLLIAMATNSQVLSEFLYVT